MALRCIECHANGLIRRVRKCPFCGGKEFEHDPDGMTSHEVRGWIIGIILLALLAWFAGYMQQTLCIGLKGQGQMMKCRAAQSHIGE